MEMQLDRNVFVALSAPFPEDEIEWLPRAVTNGRALAIAHLDRFAVMNRLDFVVGPDGWTFDWMAQGGDPKKIKGTLTVLGVSKSDAGEADKEDEPLKAAVTDAFKRCAVHFGIGRYLAYLPKPWTNYDATKRQFTERPQVSGAALNNALRICGVVDQEEPRPAAPPSSPGREKAKATMERAERPLLENNGAAQPQEPDPLARVTAKLEAVLIKHKIDARGTPGLLKHIAELALDTGVPKFGALDAADRNTVVEWVDANPEVCRELQTRIGKEQGEALPLEGTDASLPAQARGA